MQRETILYCYTSLSSFMRKDLEIISRDYHVLHAPSGHLSKAALPFALMMHLFRVMRYILLTDKILVQGAGFHSFFPALLGKIFARPCYIIIIGNDASKFPGIGYGNFSKQPLSWATKCSLKWAHKLLPVHTSLQHFEYDYAEEGRPVQGYEAFIPELKTRSTAVLNGYDPERWYRGGTQKVKSRFITAVSRFNSPSIIPLKGLDLIFTVAAELPETEFWILGLSRNEFAQNLPENVHFTGPVPHEEVRSYFASTEFYLQLSMSEGFPNAICEAMLCECVPIGSAVNAIPDIIGDTGFVLEHRDSQALTALIKTALESDTASLGAAARHRISSLYPKQKRAEDLLKALA